MNNSAREFYQKSIIDGLNLLPKKWVELFYRMYSGGDLSKNIDEVVSGIPDEKLDWALQQVENSVKKYNSAPE